MAFCFGWFNREFQCDNGACIAGDLSCDGQEDCEDSSDEKYCGELLVRVCVYDLEHAKTQIANVEREIITMRLAQT